MEKVPNFWISSFSKGHVELTSLLSEIAESPDTAPKWLSEGITYLLLETKDTKKSRKLQTYHLFPRYIQTPHRYLTERTYIFMENNNAFPLAQRKGEGGGGRGERLLWV